MISGDQILETFDGHAPPGPMADTGLAELDDLTGGLQAGHVWVITGGVGEGKSMLLTQLAVALASHRHQVQLVCPRETAAWSTRRLLSLLGRTPVDFSDRAAQRRHPRLERARSLVGGLPLGLFARDTAGFTPETDPYVEPPAAAVLVDDADLVGGMTPSRVARYAEEGRFVAVSLPREQVFEGPSDRAPLRPEWTRGSDVVVEVRTRTLRDVGTPGTPQHRPPELRPGEADLVVHRHRWGLTRTIHVAARLHYAQFTDLPAP